MVWMDRAEKENLLTITLYNLHNLNLKLIHMQKK